MVIIGFLILVLLAGLYTVIPAFFFMLFLGNVGLSVGFRGVLPGVMAFWLLSATSNMNKKTEVK